MHNTPLLVTGVGGHLGRLVAERLLDNDQGRPLVGTSRNPERLQGLARSGLQLRRADFDIPDELPHAFSKVRRLLLVSTAAANAGPHRVRQHTDAIRAAWQAGVDHIGYTSFLDADTSPLRGLAADHAYTETILAQGSAGFSILRHALYMEMLLTSLPPAIATGRLLSSNIRAGVAYVVRADCARADAAALEDGFVGRRTLNITGPEAISAIELVEQVNEVLGVRIECIQARRAEVQAHLVACGISMPMAQLLAAMDEGLGQGAMARVSDEFEQLTQSRPTSVASFLKEHREVLMAP